MCVINILFHSVLAPDLFLYQDLSALIKTSLTNRLPDQEISRLMAVKQRQKERKDNLIFKDAAAQLQNELDF
jgi:hypothetical protein